MPKKPKIVTVAFDEVKITNIKNVEMTFDVYFHIHVTWVIDNEEIKQLAVGTTGELPLKWTPPMPKFLNSQSGSMICDISTPSIALDEKKMRLVGSQTMACNGTFCEILELNNFPVDCQDLPIHLRFETHRPQIRVMASSEVTELVRIIHAPGALPEFDVKPPILEFGSIDKFVGISYNLKPEKVTFSEVTLRLKVQRKHFFYIYKIVFVLSLIQLCASSVFCLSPVDNFSDRLSYSSTMLLTVVAFQFVVSSFVPAVDYLTLLDKFIMTVTAHVVIIMLICCIIGYSGLDNDALNIVILLLNVLATPGILIVFYFKGQDALKFERLKLVANSIALKEANIEQEAEVITSASSPLYVQK